VRRVALDDRGSVTVEAAIALGAIVLVLGVVLAAVSGVVVRIRCVDAAGEAARLAARGDPGGARAAALRLLPAGTEVVVEPVGDDVRIRVRAPPLGGALPGVRVGADAVAAREPEPAGPLPGTDVAPDTASDVSDGAPP